MDERQDDRREEDRRQDDGGAERPPGVPLPVDDLIMIAEINELPRHRRRFIKVMITAD